MKSLNKLNFDQLLKQNLRSLKVMLEFAVVGMRKKPVPVTVKSAKLQAYPKQGIVNRTKLFQLMLIVTVGFGLTSCRKDLAPKPSSQTVATSTKELKVASNFDWATTRSMDVQINAANKGLLLIQDENASVIYKALVNAGDVHTTHITFGSSVKKAFVYFNGASEEINLGSTKFVTKLK
jgi:hypothetical protein